MNPQHKTLASSKEGKISNQSELVSPAIPSVVASQSISSTQPVKDSRDAVSTGLKSSNKGPEMTPIEYLEHQEARLRSLDSASGSEDEDEVDSAEEDQQSQAAVVRFEELRNVLAYDPRMLFHEELNDNDASSDFHPEDPRRIIAIYRLLCENGLVEGSPYAPDTGVVSRPLERIPSRYATKDECCRVHSERHFEDVRGTAETADEILLAKSFHGDSVYYNQSTYAAALLAAGSAIDTTLAVVKGQVKNAIAVIRPPGHHAECDSSQGFCHFDNVAVAARSAQHEFPSVKKILIIDWDIHHGNGIQQAFVDDPNVLYISLHVHADGGFYPFGPAGEIAFDGTGRGRGMNINIGWEEQGRTDGDYLMAFQHIIMPVANEYNPDLVLVASGFDAAQGDQLGGCHITPAGYSQMTHMLMSLANGKVVVCLEGGYNLRSISVSALAVTKTLMGQPPTRVVDSVATESGARTIFQVIRHHQQYWKSLVPKTNMTRADNIVEATRLHDIVRCVQAEQLFRDHRMFQLPVTRKLENGKLPSKTFDNQVLATPNFRKVKGLLVIFHEQPQLAGSADPITGEIPLSSPKVIDSVSPFIKWAIKNNIGVIDVNLPDLYTSNSHTATNEDKSTANAQLRVVSSYVWDTYVASTSAKKVVMLGVGDAFFAVQRIIAMHPQEEFEKRSVRAVGVVEGAFPGTYKKPQFLQFDHYFPLWTKVWVPESHKVFKKATDGKPNKRYGDLQASKYTTLNDMLEFHQIEIMTEILKHLDQSSEQQDSGDKDDDEEEEASSDTSGKSVLGKRAREGATDGDDGDDAGKSRSARIRISKK